MATEEYNTTTAQDAFVQAEVGPVPATKTTVPITLQVETNNGTYSVALQITRRAILDLERKGILNAKAGESQPIVYTYALAHAAVKGTIPNVTQAQVDQALDLYFDNDGSFEELSALLTEQYGAAFNIAAATGVN